MGDQKYVMVFHFFCELFCDAFRDFFSVLNTRYVLC